MQKQNVTQKDFSRAWSYLIAAFPEANELDNLNFEVYYDALHEFPIEQIITGFKRFISDSGSRFFPAAPQIRAWVAPVLNQEDKTFEHAIKEHEERQYHKWRKIMDCLQEMKDNRMVFCQVRWNQDDPYRDTWKWMTLGETVEKYANKVYLTADFMLGEINKYRRLPFHGTSREHHILNSVAAWDQKQIGAGVDAEIVGE